MLAVGGAVLGSLQFGYNTGVINAPQKVSAVPSLASQHQQAVAPSAHPTHIHAHPASWMLETSPANILTLNGLETCSFGLGILRPTESRDLYRSSRPTSPTTRTFVELRAVLHVVMHSRGLWVSYRGCLGDSLTCCSHRTVRQAGR